MIVETLNKELDALASAFQCEVIEARKGLSLEQPNGASPDLVIAVVSTLLPRTASANAATRLISSIDK
jgi:hypothetical protein